MFLGTYKLVITGKFEKFGSCPPTFESVSWLNTHILSKLLTLNKKLLTKNQVMANLKSLVMVLLIALFPLP